MRGGKEVTLVPGQTFYEGPNDVHTVGRNIPYVTAQIFFGSGRMLTEPVALAFSVPID